MVKIIGRVGERHANPDDRLMVMNRKVHTWPTGSCKINGLVDSFWINAKHAIDMRAKLSQTGKWW